MERIFVLIGIIHQLATTRLNRVLKELDLPLAQFNLLMHFSVNADQGFTVTRLAEVMEVNQPAMTKTTQRLSGKGLLQMVRESADKRIKTFYLTAQGLEVVKQAWARLEPDMNNFMAAWQPEELDQLRGLLERLKNQLDEARDE